MRCTVASSTTGIRLLYNGHDTKEVQRTATSLLYTSKRSMKRDLPILTNPSKTAIVSVGSLVLQNLMLWFVHGFMKCVLYPLS